MELLFFKSIHIVASIIWMSTMFINSVLFYFHRQIKLGGTTHIEQSNLLTTIEKSIYKYFMTPSMLLVWVAGLTMLYIHGYEWFRTNMWMHHKLLLILLLTAYHGMSKGWIKVLENPKGDLSLVKWKIAFFLPFVFTTGIVPLAVYKNSVAAHFLTIPMILLLVIMFVFPLSSKNNAQ